MSGAVKIPRELFQDTAYYFAMMTEPNSAGGLLLKSCSFRLSQLLRWGLVNVTFRFIHIACARCPPATICDGGTKSFNMNSLFTDTSAGPTAGDLVTS